MIFQAKEPVLTDTQVTESQGTVLWLRLQILPLAVEQVADTAGENEVDLIAAGGGLLVIDGGHDDDHIPALGIGVEMNLAAHHLGYIYSSRQGVGPFAQSDMTGPHTQRDGLGLGIL